MYPSSNSPNQRVMTLLGFYVVEQRDKSECQHKEWGSEVMDSSAAAILDVTRQLPKINGSYIFGMVQGIEVTYTLDQGTW